MSRLTTTECDNYKIHISYNFIRRPCTVLEKLVFFEWRWDVSRGLEEVEGFVNIFFGCSMCTVGKMCRILVDLSVVEIDTNIQLRKYAQVWKIIPTEKKSGRKLEVGCFE